MRNVPAAIVDALNSRDFIGDQRAVTRVTIQKVSMGVYPVGSAIYSSIAFPGDGAQGALELPNLKGVSWNRSTDDAVGTAHLDLFNTQPLPPGAMPPIDDAYDQLGYFTFNRAATPLSTATWGHVPNKWQDYLVPDRVIRIYQGYGANYLVRPEDDPHLVLMGCYLIDEVTYAHDGTISVDARDYGRMLMEQLCFPPVIPNDRYPLQFTHYHDVQDPDVITTTGGVGWRKPTYDTDSNVVRLGRNGAENGHHGTDAFDGNESSFWMSTGNATPGQFYSFEYIQGAISGHVTGARCHVWGGPYTVYVSVRVGNTWQGAQVIPYDPSRAPSRNHSNIPFVASGRVDRDGEVSFTLDVTGVTAVRFTFTDLFNSGIGTYKYRAGVRTFEVLQDTTATVTTPGGTHTEGNYEDYSDVVKLLLAYGGFWWPRPPGAYQVLTDGARRNIDYSNGEDPVLAGGRIWGDIEISGAPQHGIINDMGIGVFNLKPLMDGILHVRDMIGFIFYIDETGGAIFRLPNIFKRGSHVINADGIGGKGRTTSAILIRDENTLLSLRSRLSSRNTRERVIVSNSAGGLAAVAHGRPPQEVNFRRVAVYSDQYFSQQADVTVMADLIALRQLFTYRQNTLQIAADPRIQIDDQIQIQERTTGEDYLHYVSAISSEWSVESGKWTYDLTTSWLGSDPEAAWAFRSDDLQNETKDYLNSLGYLPGGSTPGKTGV